VRSPGRFDVFKKRREGHEIGAQWPVTSSTVSDVAGVKTVKPAPVESRPRVVVRSKNPFCELRNAA
jgi:hypothetical protein